MPKPIIDELHEHASGAVVEALDTLAKVAPVCPACMRFLAMPRACRQEPTRPYAVECECGWTGQAVFFERQRFG